MSKARCTICNHADRTAIERDIRSGDAPLRALADRYSVSKSALVRQRPHMVADHVPDHRPTCPPGEPIAIRVRQALRLRAKGLSHVEIAAALNVTPTTVGDWFTDARRAAVLTLQQSTAEEYLADIRLNNDLMREELMAALDDAKASGDRRARVNCLRELRQLDQQAFDVAERLGAFDRVRLPSSFSTQEDGMSGGNVLKEAVRDFAQNVFGPGAPSLEELERMYGFRLDAHDRQLAGAARPIGRA